MAETDGNRPAHGFGLRPTGAEEDRRRRAAALAVARLLGAEGLPAPAEDVLEAFSVCKGLFNRVARQDQPDWFATQVRLGYPDGERCGRIAVALSACRSAARAGDAAAWAGARLETRRLRTRRGLASYRGRRALPDHPGSGFAYVMSDRADPDLLVVGAAARPILEQAAAVNAGRAGQPLGVRAFWWVTDALAAAAIVEAAMGARSEGDGTGAYRANFFAVLTRLERALSAESLVMDPYASLARVPAGRGAAP